MLQVADGALRCFASLADRFIRRGIDPAPLAKNGLMEELLTRLSNATSSSGINVSSTLSTTPEAKSSNQSFSIVISLLSTLCRGSESFTHDLFRSDLPHSIEKALQGDDRQVKIFGILVLDDDTIGTNFQVHLGHHETGGSSSCPSL